MSGGKGGKQTHPCPLRWLKSKTSFATFHCGFWISFSPPFLASSTPSSSSPNIVLNSSLITPYVPSASPSSSNSTPFARPSHVFLAYPGLGMTTAATMSMRAASPSFSAAYAIRRKQWRIFTVSLSLKSGLARKPTRAPLIVPQYSFG